MEERKNLLPTNGSLPALSAPQKNSTPSNRDAILATLARLSLHYFRPDFTEGQAKLLMTDMLNDLAPYTPQEVSDACAMWRRDPNGKYFPRSGQIIGMIEKARAARVADWRAKRPGYSKPKQIEHRAGPLKPWRQVLRENGRLP